MILGLFLSSGSIGFKGLALLNTASSCSHKEVPVQIGGPYNYILHIPHSHHFLFLPLHLSLFLSLSLSLFLSPSLSPPFLLPFSPSPYPSLLCLLVRIFSHVKILGQQ